MRENLREAITFPKLQAITAASEGEAGLGEIAKQYLRKFASKQEVDKTLF